MNSTGVLDDYLEELLGDAVPVTAVAIADTEDASGVAEAIRAEFTADDDAPAFDTPTSPGAPAAMALLDELMNDPALGPVVEAAPAAAVFDTPTSPGAPAALALLDELLNDPALGPVAAAPAFETPTSPGAPAHLALLDELLNDPALGPVEVAATPDASRPSWDDLPPEALHDTVPVAAAAPVAAPVRAPTPAAAAAPVARSAPPPPAPAATPRAAPPAAAPALSGRPSSWQELQAQARNPASSPRGDRRASERTSRWLRLRCGPQAYALELLKVQEVVLPVPLLPLRGTPSAMLGIMNLRGQVVPVMDLGIHLGTGPARDDANTRIVVLEEDGETMGLRVSAVEDVANLTDSQIEPPDTARICQISNDLFRGVARVTAQPMILLDATQLLN